MGFCSTGPLQSHQDEVGEAGGIRKASERNPDDPPPPDKGPSPGHRSSAPETTDVWPRGGVRRRFSCVASVVDFVVFNYSWMGKSSASLSGSPGESRTLARLKPTSPFLSVSAVIHPATPASAQTYILPGFSPAPRQLSTQPQQ